MVAPLMTILIWTHKKPQVRVYMGRQKTIYLQPACTNPSFQGYAPPWLGFLLENIL